jgi:hypothetical protein
MRLLAVFALALALPGVAGASTLIDRNAKNVSLKVSADGTALMTYFARDKVQHVLAWGAINAIAPTRTRPQVNFKLDYAGGWGKARRPLWKGFKNACGPYNGPQLYWLVTACTAPDGSHWALQAWQRMLPNYGLRPSARQAVWELRLSHWTDELPVLEVKLNWAYRRFDHVYGRFTYAGNPVFGFRSTRFGNPLDTFGRNLYVDTFNSRYGRGWKRENSFLMHTGSGAFCYGFYPHGRRAAGNGRAYRATIIGPGVTPDIFWQSSAPGPYDRARDLAANDEIRSLGSRQCRPN